jgi:acyl-CoA oxidase
MPSNPSWVTALKPSGPQGSELLKQERSKSNLDVDRLANFMFSKEVLERNQRLLEILEAEEVFDKSQNYFRGRNERIQAALARGKRLRQLSVKHNWSREDYQVANELISEPTPYGLHASMFLVSYCRQPIGAAADSVPPGDPTRARYPRTAQALP